MNTIPETTVARVRAELQLVSRELGGIQTKLGVVHDGGHAYLGIVLVGVGVNAELFAARDPVSKVNALILLPAGYPVMPPLGVYVNYNFQYSGAAHNVGRGYHGAPTLTDKGWFWFCFGYALGEAAALSPWRPGSRPDNGHNLGTIIASARAQLSLGKN